MIGPAPHGWEECCECMGTGHTVGGKYDGELCDWCEGAGIVPLTTAEWQETWGE